MEFDDPQWLHMRGGYRVPYDPREALLALERADADRADLINDVWNELWGNLYHQGDVGEASYTAVPHLVRIHAARGIPDWNTYALVAAIEEARREERNPQLPAELRDAYEDAWTDLVALGLRELAAAEDPSLVSSIIGVLAMAKGRFTLGRLAVNYSEEELQEIISAAG